MLTQNASGGHSKLSYFDSIVYFFHSPRVALINERLESLICTPVPQFPLQSVGVENPCHLTPPSAGSD